MFADDGRRRHVEGAAYRRHTAQARRDQYSDRRPSLRPRGLLTLFAAGLLLKFSHFGLIAAPLLIGAVLVGMPLVLRLMRYCANAIDPIAGGNESTLRQYFARFVPLGIRQLAVQTPWPWVMFWAFLVQGLNLAMAVAAARAIGLQVPWIEIVVATAMVTLAVALPISIAGVGVREASFPLLLAADGVPQELAITLGIALSGIVLVAGLLGGPIHLWRNAPPNVNANPTARDNSRRATYCITENHYETFCRSSAL